MGIDAQPLAAAVPCTAARELGDKAGISGVKLVVKNGCDLTGLIVGALRERGAACIAAVSNPPARLDAAAARRRL